MNISRVLLRTIIIALGKMGLIHRFFSIGTRIAKFILPEERTIEVGKYRMIINPKEDLGLYFGYEGVEPEVVHALKRLLKRGDTFFDVGAYKGYYSLMTSELVGESGKVVAFEPDRKAFDCLLKNIKINKISNIIAKNIALSDFEGRSGFVKAGTIGHLGDSDQVVEVKSLDSVVNDLKIIPDVIKMDVEGVEYSVLRGGESVLKHYHPKLIIEVHTNANFQFFEYLTNLGYNIGLLNETEVLWMNLEEIKRKCLDRQTTKYGTKMNRHIYCEVKE